MKVEGKHTRLDNISKLLPNGQKQHLLPCLLTLVLRHAKRPGTTFDITRIFPDRFDAALEEMDRIFHLERFERKVVICLPEGFDCDNVLEQDSKAAFITTVLRVLVVVECPGVLKGRRSHTAKHIVFGDSSLGGG